ncbi:hypothetical protein L6164_014241 [Bauhinia variegata]|uniref:Uncharacterized protein n=1 Tax=Bauhinia variegata TaxID=167791 RepID=A0ACB9NGJ2_BAUVA|nr:hypothetical protein L6164_014241 [Bauhinia variegata]
MNAGAAQLMLQCVFDGSISMNDWEVERRPYHKNCGCAIHYFKGVCSNACSQPRRISFPKRSSWSHCSMQATPSNFFSQYSLLCTSIKINLRDDKTKDAQVVS